jgi:hypothetical protein
MGVAARTRAAEHFGAARFLDEWETMLRAGRAGRQA